MSVPNQTPFTTAVGNGVTTDFPFEFLTVQASDLVVSLDGVDLPNGAGYTVSGVGAAGGGTVAFAAPPAAGVVVLISRNITLLRSTDYQYQGEIQAQTLNSDFDRLWLALQGIASGLAGAIRVPYPERSVALPGAALRAQKMLAFDSAGAPTVTPFTVTQLSSVIAAAYAGSAGPLDALAFVAAGIGAVTRSAQDKARDAIHVKDYGAIGNGVVDDTLALQRAAAVALAQKKLLDLTGAPNGWLLRGRLSLTGMAGVIAAFNSPILVDPNGTFANGWAVEIGDPTVDGGNGRSNGFSLLGHLHVAATSRFKSNGTTPGGVFGVYLKGSLMDTGSITTQNFHGTGFFGDSVWDSVIGPVSTDNCGNLTSYALRANSTGDTNNCTHWLRFQCEAAVQKGLDLNLIRSQVGPIHAERLRIITTNDGTATMANGGNYQNHSLVIGNSLMGQVQMDAAQTGLPTPDGTTVASRIVLSEYADASKMGPLEMGAGDIVVTGGEGFTLDTATVDRVFQRAPASNTRFIGLKANLFSAESGVTVEGARYIGTFTPSFNGALQKVFGGTVGTVNFTNAILGDISFVGVKIDQVLDTLGATGPGRENTSFTDCEINTWAGAFNARARVMGGYINTAALVSQAAPEFYNVQFGTFGYSGNTGHVTIGCRASTVTGWSPPLNVAYPAGTRTERLGYASGQGDRYVNTNGAANWAAINNLP